MNEYMDINTALTPEQVAKLTRLQRRATVYEIVLTHNETGDRRLLCYSDRTRSRVFRYAMKHGETLAAFCATDRWEPSTAAGVMATIGTWRISASGRTQREAIMHGELPWFGHSVQ